MPGILFLPYHGFGHINSFLKPARILKDHYEIVFAAHEYFNTYVKSQGFTVWPMKSLPFALGFERWSNQTRKRRPLFWHVWRDRWTDRLYHERKNELLGILDACNPTHVVLDRWQSTDFVVLYPYLKKRNIKVCFINAMLPLQITTQGWPLCLDVSPTDPCHRGQVRKLILKRKFQRCIQFIRYTGRDNHSLFRERLNRNALPPGYEPKYDSIFSFPIDRIAEFICAPRELDFSLPEDHQHFIGSMIDFDRMERVDPRFQDYQEEIHSKIMQGKKLIYCSFGSVHYKKENTMRRFQSLLIQAIDGGNCILLLSTALPGSDAFHNPASGVYVFKSVPQLAVLQHARAFVSHGGLNSIKESIHFGVPLLVYPVDHHTDQPGNAARVRYHRIGLTGRLHAETRESIRAKIARLMQDPVYHEQLNHFKTREQNYTEAQFLERFRNLKTLF